MRFKIKLAVILVLLLPAISFAGEAPTISTEGDSTTPVKSKSTMGPAITNYGPVYQVEDLDVPLPADFVYKAVFDVYNTASDMDAHSRRLESVARFINMHALHGVPLDHMKLAVVFHGKATKDILTNAAYQKQYQVDNPNKALIEALASKGVKLFVCGQSATYHDYHRQDILPQVNIALSALTQLTVLQTQGYALLPQ